jgi:hypothetical protein
MRRLSLGLLTLFPQAWRERYEGEMRALLAEQKIRPRTFVDLVRAAGDAHLHPHGMRPAAVERMRNTAGAALCGWIAFVLCGSGFAKLTEDRPFATAGVAHPLLGDTRTAIAVLAVLSLAAVLLGGGPLIAGVLLEAWTKRRAPLVRAVCAPFAAVVTFCLATGVLAWLANGGRVQAHTAGAWFAFLVWFAIALGGAAVCGLSSRTALRLAHPPPVALRAGVGGAAVLAVVLGLTTAATALYGVTIAVDVPALANEANGPLGLVSTTVALAVLVALMATITALAAVTSLRGLRALRAAD